MSKEKENKANLEKKSSLEKKVEAWKTLNTCLIQANSQFMQNLHNLLKVKEEELEAIKEKLQNSTSSNTATATEEDNIHLLFLAGYIQGLKDILSNSSTLKTT